MKKWLQLYRREEHLDKTIDLLQKPEIEKSHSFEEEFEIYCHCSPNTDVTKENTVSSKLFG